MKVDVLVAEIGSTTTVLNAFINIDSDQPVFWGQGQAPTSVLEGDVRIGLKGALDDMCKRMGEEKIEYDKMLATSSAAGGLKMSVHGLVYDMTARAAREAALGAGGIIHFVTAGKLRRTDLAKIKEIRPNLILLAGGVDYGEKETAIDTAEKLRDLDYKAPVIYAGNIENREEMKLIFDDRKLYICDNVYPKIDMLNVEPCRRMIHQAFEDHIIHAPGMEHVRDMVNGPIIPTPGSVMECTKLLSDCIGNVMTIDVGGATTDVHSVTTDSDDLAAMMTTPEPKAKRTVEGDLGLYVNRMHVIESIGEDELRKRLAPVDLDKTLESYVAIPKTPDEFKLVELLAEEATLKAVERHAGIIRYVYGPTGRTTVVEGKDLTQVQYIVGTGGALTRLPHRVEIMKEIPAYNESGMLLFPTDHAQILVDNDYIMASLGVLSKEYREAAIKLLEKSLDFKFPEVLAKDQKSAMQMALEEAERRSKQLAEEEEHIKEMEEMGYDMTVYKKDLEARKNKGKEQHEMDSSEAPAVPVDEDGCPLPEGAEAAFDALIEKDEQAAEAAFEAHHKAAAADMKPSEAMEQQHEQTAGCNHECWLCPHVYCPNRKYKRGEPPEGR